LLAQTDLPMSQVALAAGFKESKRLSVVFRQETGMSPSEYRQEYRCAPEAMDGAHVTGRAH
jgi:transcriptional regulator GlxA family with amidase domain